MCTKKRLENRDNIKMEGFEVHETRRADADDDKQGGGLTILTRKKDGIIFKRCHPRIQEEKHAFVDKKRLLIVYDSKAGKTAVCCLYLGFQNSTDSHGKLNDDIYSTVSKEVFDLGKPSEEKISLCLDF